jgi:hypothetical protein
MKGKFMYRFPHPYFLWSSGYRIGENKERRKKNYGERERDLVAYWNEDLVDTYNMANVLYCFFLRSNLGIQMFKLDRC